MEYRFGTINKYVNTLKTLTSVRTTIYHYQTTSIYILEVSFFYVSKTGLLEGTNGQISTS